MHDTYSHCRTCGRDFRGPDACKNDVTIAMPAGHLLYLSVCNDCVKKIGDFVEALMPKREFADDLEKLRPGKALRLVTSKA